MFTYFNCSTMFPCPTIPPVSSTPDCGAQAHNLRHTAHCYRTGSGGSDGAANLKAHNWGHTAYIHCPDTHMPGCGYTQNYCPPYNQGGAQAQGGTWYGCSPHHQGGIQGTSEPLLPKYRNVQTCYGYTGPGPVIPPHHQGGAQAQGGTWVGYCPHGDTYFGYCG